MTFVGLGKNHSKPYCSISKFALSFIQSSDILMKQPKLFAGYSIIYGGCLFQTGGYLLLKVKILPLYSQIIWDPDIQF